MSSTRLLALKVLGQHGWLDNLSRSLLHMINQKQINGVTSNLAIFDKVIIASHYCRDDLRSKGLSAEACYISLTVLEVRLVMLI